MIMKIIQNKLVPFSGYLAINIFGIIFTRNKEKLSKNIKCLRHEYTHTLQWKELWYVGFLPLYCYYYLKNRFWYKMKHKEAYKNIPFEKEAYCHQEDFDYNLYRTRFAWKKYV